MKILGASSSILSRGLALESLVLALLASTLGVVLSMGVGALLSLWILDSTPALPPLSWALGVPLGFATTGAWMGWLAARTAVRREPQEWLRAMGSG